MKSQKLSSASFARFDPTELWMAARRLGGEEELEWSFPIMASRVLSLRADGPRYLTGIDNFYEPIRTWDEILWVLWVDDQLEQAGIGRLWVLKIGCDVFDTVFRAPNGRIIVPSAGEPFRGRHLFVVLGLGPHGDLAVKNSWGEAWGDEGDGYITRDYYENFVDDVWLNRSSSMGCSVAMRNALSTVMSERAPSLIMSDPFVITSAWSKPTETIRKEKQVAGVRYTLRRRQLFLATPPLEKADLVDLTSPEGQIVGRMHCVHEQRSRVTIVQELFVHESHRRRGCGTALFSVAVDRACFFGSTEVRLLLHEADAGRTRSGSLAFGESVGLTWHTVDNRRPKVDAIGIMAA